MTDETIVLDPPGILPERVKLGLDELGIRVKEADWGESAVELFLVKQAKGEIPAERHPPNRAVTIKLIVEKDSPVSLAEAAQKLQMKVGLWQAEGGWVERVLDSAGGFATSVLQEVRSATLIGLHGWYMAHRQTAPEVTLTLTTGPYVYSTQEYESSVIKESTKRQLQWEIAQVLGTAPGLIRLAVKNENNSAAWKGLLSAMESRDHPQDATKNTTAALAYEATTLEKLGGSTTAERDSLSVVRNTKLTAGWIAILGSKTESGHMTHRGARRLWFRVYDPSEAAEEIELKLEWRPLGAIQWSVNPAIKTPIAGGWAEVNLGECRPEAPVIGNPKWEWRLMARAVKGSGTIDVYIVYPLPTEQYMMLATPSSGINPDKTELQSPETAVDYEGKSGGTVAWATPTNVKASDNTYATCECTFQLSHFLKITGFGFAIPEAASVSGWMASFEKAGTGAVYDNQVSAVKNGGILSANYAKPDLWPSTDTVVNYGPYQWGAKPPAPPVPWTPAEINSANFGVAISVEGTHIAKAFIDHVSITVYYTEAGDENRICFATRSIQLRSDGVYRQHATEDVWGRGTPIGSLPYAAPSGLEERALRGIIIPSQGDLATQPDVGTNKESVQIFYRPAYLFTSEAE